MKLLTIIIPCYNSEPFIERCLDSLLIGLDDKLEVFVINDGSTDNTSKIAHQYSKQHPFIQVIDKENGGHGSAINLGLKLATGLYFKVFDSDDGLDRIGLLNLIFYIEKHLQDNTLPDIYFTDYYSVSDVDHSKVLVDIGSTFKKPNIVSTYHNMKKMPFTGFLMMHMMYFKTSLLVDNKVEVLERCFYEDNQLLFYAINYASTLCYLDKPIYQYTVSRKGQSISLNKMSENYQHQMRVMDACYNKFDYETIISYDRYKRRAVFNDIDKLAFLALFYSHLQISKSQKTDYKYLIRTLKNNDKALYRKIYHRSRVSVLGLFPYRIKVSFLKMSYSLFSKNLGWS